MDMDGATNDLTSHKIQLVVRLYCDADFAATPILKLLFCVSHFDITNILEINNNSLKQVLVKCCQELLSTQKS